MTNEFIERTMRRRGALVDYFWQPYFHYSEKILKGEIPDPSEISHDFAKAVRVAWLYQKDIGLPHAVAYKGRKALFKLEESDPHQQKIARRYRDIWRKGIAHPGISLSSAVRLGDAGEIAVSVYETVQTINLLGKTTKVELAKGFTEIGSISAFLDGEPIRAVIPRDQSPALYTLVLKVPETGLQRLSYSTDNAGPRLNGERYLDVSEIDGKKKISFIPALV